MKIVSIVVISHFNLYKIEKEILKKKLKIFHLGRVDDDEISPKQ